MKPFRHRWWYHGPRNSSSQKPMLKFYRCGDEFCNDTVYLRLPFLGSVTVRVNWRIRRDDACGKCIAEYGPWCSGCQSCHRGSRCHQWIDCRHEPAPLRHCPACGGLYCWLCEREPRERCPSRERTVPPDVAFYWRQPYDPNVISSE